MKLRSVTLEASGGTEVNDPRSSEVGSSTRDADAGLRADSRHGRRSLNQSAKGGKSSPWYSQSPKCVPWSRVSQWPS